MAKGQLGWIERERQATQAGGMKGIEGKKNAIKAKKSRKERGTKDLKFEVDERR